MRRFFGITRIVDGGLLCRVSRGAIPLENARHRCLRCTGLSRGEANVSHGSETGMQPIEISSIKGECQVPRQNKSETTYGTSPGRDTILSEIDL